MNGVTTDKQAVSPTFKLPSMRPFVPRHLLYYCSFRVLVILSKVTKESIPL